MANQIHTKKKIKKNPYSFYIFNFLFFFLKSATVIVDIFSYYLSFTFSGFYPSQNFVFEISFGEYSFTIFKTSRLSLCFEDNHRQEFLGKKKKGGNASVITSSRSKRRRETKQSAPFLYMHRSCLEKGIPPGTIRVGCII